MKKFLLGLFLLLGVTVFVKEIVPKPEIVKKQHYVVNMSAGIVPLADYSAKNSTVDGDGAGFDFDVTVTKEIK